MLMSKIETKLSCISLEQLMDCFHCELYCLCLSLVTTCILTDKTDIPNQNT